jgi:hypothetical protein
MQPGREYVSDPPEIITIGRYEKPVLCTYDVPEERRHSPQNNRYHCRPNVAILAIKQEVANKPTSSIVRKKENRVHILSKCPFKYSTFSL